jgi:hypothetical protein
MRSGLPSVKALTNTISMSRLSLKMAVFGAGALAGCLLAGKVEAQTLNQQVDQAQQVQRVRGLTSPQQSANSADPSLYSGEEEDTGNQTILSAAPQKRWDWININLDSQYFYTSNASLSNVNIKGTGLLVSTIEAVLAAPPITVPYGQLSSQAGFEYQWFDYGLGGPSDDFSNLDFDTATVFVEEQYALPDNWSIFGNLSYTRLLNDGNGFNEFYKELVPTLSLEKSIPIRKNLQASVEYSGNYRFTDEAPFPNQGRRCNNRTDQVLDFELTWQVTPKIDIRPFYRFQYSYYPDFFASQTRNDFLHTLGVSADYYFNSWSSIRVFVSYELLDTDAASVGDYRKLDVGGGASAGFKF